MLIVKCLNIKERKSNNDFLSLINAESVRFELTEQLPVHRFSRPAHSTTLAAFLVLIGITKVVFFFDLF